jgi:hypothetical protein
MEDHALKFLEAFAKKDFHVLVQKTLAQDQRDGKSAELHQAKRPRYEQVQEQLSFMGTQAAAAQALANSTAAPASPRRQGALDTDFVDIQSLQRRLQDLERKVHNQSRGGRNFLYYQVLHTHGPAAAAAFWNPFPPSAQSASKGSSSSSGSGARPLRIDEVNPPPEPVLPS